MLVLLVEFRQGIHFEFALDVLMSLDVTVKRQTWKFSLETWAWEVLTNGNALNSKFFLCCLLYNNFRNGQLLCISLLEIRMCENLLDVRR